MRFNCYVTLHYNKYDNIHISHFFAVLFIICFTCEELIGLTSKCDTTLTAIKPVKACIVLSYRWGEGSIVPSGTISISLLIDKLLAAINSFALSILTPNVS